MTELIYRGTGKPHDGIKLLPPPPPWRSFASGGEGPEYTAREWDASRDPDRAEVYRPTAQVIDMVNAALLLRRPLLVTGPPGAGKSTLAYSVAHELGLGQVLRWPITRSSALIQGLYEYDAAGRLEDASLGVSGVPEIGDYIRLGPLGTALLPGSFPRVLLIDDLDNSDMDLPGELHTVFTEGAFEIPQLVRLGDRQREVSVRTSDGAGWALVRDGTVCCQCFPIVIITSTDERSYPVQFLQRCLRLQLGQPDSEQLAKIVAAHLGEDLARDSRDLIAQVARLDDPPSVDQLLSAIYVAHSGIGTAVDAERIREALLRRVAEDDWG